MKQGDVFVVIGIAVVSFFLGCLLASTGSQSLMEKRAIKAGVAYYTNNESGESVFKWREVK